MDFLYSYPSIAVWVPFNEAWGQFKTEEIVEWTKAYDPGRLVNAASGGNHYRTGDILDLHNYPGPELYLYDAERATVLGEYGGFLKYPEPANTYMHNVFSYWRQFGLTTFISVCLLFAITIRPDVSLSILCTRPGRPSLSGIVGKF